MGTLMVWIDRTITQTHKGEIQMGTLAPVVRQEQIIRMQHITSSIVRAYGYLSRAAMPGAIEEIGSDQLGGTLRVKFIGRGGKPDTVYDYPNVIHEDYALLENADSFGSHIQKVIIPKYGANVVRLDIQEGEWDGEERRVLEEPLTVREATQSTDAMLVDGQDRAIAVNAGDFLTKDDEARLIERIAACVNACVGLPTIALEEVINTGFAAKGFDRRRRAEADLVDLREGIGDPGQP